MVTIAKKTDIALIVLLIIFAAAFYFLFGSSGDAGGVIIISVGGAVYKELPLSEDAEAMIYLPDGAHVNTLIISDGAAYMSYADCPDGTCLMRGPVRLTGEMIVCLPNRIIAEVTGGVAEFDAVAG